MSNDIDRDDTILGTALARAVESQSVRETPFDRSRLAARLARPVRAFPWTELAAAAVLVGGVGLAALALGQRGAPAESPIPAATHTPAATAVATPTTAGTVDLRVWFAEADLVPVGAIVRYPSSGTTPEARIADRVRMLLGAGQFDTPQGAFNAVAVTPAQTSVNVSVAVQGDLARVALDATNGWPVRGAAHESAFVQQLVYTITEEPGIRRALLTGKDGVPLRLDQTVIDKPLTREDVMAYSFRGTDVPSIEYDGGAEAKERITGVRAENDLFVHRGRVSIDLRATTAQPGGRLDPRITATLEECDPCRKQNGPGKWAVRLKLPDVLSPTPMTIEVTSSTTGPIQAVDGPVIGGPGTEFTIVLDDARPWRVSIEPTGTDMARINVDVGGVPVMVNKNIAVYAPLPNLGVRGGVVVSGAARVFEANVVWRLRDSSGREVARGNTTASQGTSPVWGVFETTVQVPQGLTGSATLEVFWVSPKDGSDQDVIQIPPTVR